MKTLEKAKRIVIKIGSALLINQDTGDIRDAWLKSLVDDVMSLKKSGKEVVIVSSGAVAVGRKNIYRNKSSLKLEEKQAAAACGQVELVGKYQSLFREHDVTTAQILLTIFDSENRRSYLNARNTIEALLACGAVPVINENDTVATQELRFGDNDRLAARVAQMIGADLLILLSDIDGLYTSNPRLNSNAEHIKIVDKVTKEIEDMADIALKSGVGSGGMITKIEAAKIATSSGCVMVLASGKSNNPIRKIADGGVHTLFKSSDSPLNARKRWILSSLNVTGGVVIDGGAVQALRKGKSLLPAGVIDINGHFERGDTISVKDHNLQEIGKGMSAYSSDDAKLIIGQHSSEIENITGFSGRDEIIHKDDLVLGE